MFVACLSLLVLPTIILAQGQSVSSDASSNSGFHLVVCGTGEAGAMDCDFEKLKELVGKTFDYIIGYIVLPVATILIIWAGFKIIVGAYQGKDLSAARQMIKNIIIGIVLTVGAYAIVKTVADLFFDSQGAFRTIIQQVFGNN